MRRIGRRVFVAVVGLLAASLMMATPAVASELWLGAPLYGTSNYSYAAGHAHYEQCCGHREFDTRMWNMYKLQGKTLVVYAAGHNVGTMRVGSDGRCHLHRDTRIGQYVPRLYAGDVVAIRTQSGSLVAKGTLHRMMMM